MGYENDKLIQFQASPGPVRRTAAGRGKRCAAASRGGDVTLASSLPGEERLIYQGATRATEPTREKCPKSESLRAIMIRISRGAVAPAGGRPVGVGTWQNCHVSFVSRDIPTSCTHGYVDLTILRSALYPNPNIHDS